jgi:hypothetical protein
VTTVPDPIGNALRSMFADLYRGVGLDVAGPGAGEFRTMVLCPEGHDVPEGTDCAHGCPHPDCPTCPGRSL